MNREEWLNRFLEAARPHFARVGAPLPRNVRVSIGFPSGGTRGKAIGECWGTTSTSDGHFEIFLRPSIEADARIADVLTHEAMHAAVGLEAKHGAAFKRIAVALGLRGKMTATIAGPGWHTWAQPILDQLGPLPGAPLREFHSGRKKQTTRMLKCTCDACGFAFRTTRSHIEAHPDGLDCPVRDCAGAIQGVL